MQAVGEQDLEVVSALGSLELSGEGSLMEIIEE